MNADKMRAEFEAWCVGFHIGSPLERYDDDPAVYRDWHVQCAWCAWQASRAALVIELPPEWPPISEKDEGANEMRENCAIAIEAAGVTVK